jgi:uncharacterized membrane protein HdeD (DUF308 family)
MIAFGLRVDLPRFLLLGAFSILLGLTVCFVCPSLRSAAAIYFAGMGCMLLLSGIFTLWRYVRAAPQHPEEA